MSTQLLAAKPLNEVNFNSLRSAVSMLADKVEQLMKQVEEQAKEIMKLRSQPVAQKVVESVQVAAEAKTKKKAQEQQVWHTSDAPLDDEVSILMNSEMRRLLNVKAREMGITTGSLVRQLLVQNTPALQEWVGVTKKRPGPQRKIKD
jgi:hypothetical protein